MGKIIRLVDRSRTTTDWVCPRKRWWQYEYKSRGIVKTGTSLELFTGTTIHDALATIGTLVMNEKAVPIDDIARSAYLQIYNQLTHTQNGILEPDVDEFAMEQGTLTEGLIRGFYRHVWPKLMDMYPEIVCVEQEMEYQLGTTKSIDPVSGEEIETEFVFMTKPDLIVEDREGNLVYIEYKSTSSKKEQWINSWDTAVQLHSSVKATEASLGRLPSAVQIVGLYKGYESYGKQSSPMCYAYKKSGNPPFTQDQIQYEFKAGFKRFATWTLPGGVKAWVEGMPDSILANQFPLTAPIHIDETLIDSFFKQRLHREKEITDAGQHESNPISEHSVQTNEGSGGLPTGTIADESTRGGATSVILLGESVHSSNELDRVFPQHFEACRPAYGYGCQYYKLCFGHVNDPFDEGFVWREPHHDLEREQLGLELIQQD